MQNASVCTPLVMRTVVCCYLCKKSFLPVRLNARPCICILPCMSRPWSRAAVMPSTQWGQLRYLYTCRVERNRNYTPIVLYHGRSVCRCWGPSEYHSVPRVARLVWEHFWHIALLGIPGTSFCMRWNNLGWPTRAILRRL